MRDSANIYPPAVRISHVGGLDLSWSLNISAGVSFNAMADGKVLIGSVVRDYLVCVLVSPAQDDILRLYAVKGESLSPPAP